MTSNEKDMDLPPPNLKETSMYVGKKEEKCKGPFTPRNIEIVSHAKNSNNGLETPPHEFRYNSALKSSIHGCNKFFDTLKDSPQIVSKGDISKSDSIFEGKKQDTSGKKRLRNAPDFIFNKLPGNRQREISKSLLVNDVLSSPQNFEHELIENKKSSISQGQNLKEKRELEEAIRKRVEKKMELIENEKKENVSHFKARERVRKRCNDKLYGRSEHLTTKQAKKLKCFLHEKTPPMKTKLSSRGELSLRASGSAERKRVFNKSKSCKSFVGRKYNKNSNKNKKRRNQFERYFQDE